jgi:hypothetical protein
MVWEPKKCPKCGTMMIEDSENYGDRLHEGWVCLSLNCGYNEKIRLVRCCDCKNYTFDPKDTIPFHCPKMHRCMSLIHIPAPCDGYNQKEGVRINWNDGKP